MNRLRRHRRRAHILQHNQWSLTAKFFFLLSFSRSVIAKCCYYSFRMENKKERERKKNAFCLQLFTLNMRVRVPVHSL